MAMTIDRASTTIKLPSAGLLGVPAEVQIRAITGREEMKMTSVAFSNYLELIINSCVKSTDGSDIDVNKLTGPDKWYCLIMIRSLTYGDKLLTHIKCPTCGKENDVEINLSDLEVTYLEAKDLDKLTNITLPASKIKVTLGLLTDGEITEIETRAKKQSKELGADYDELKRTYLYMQRIRSMTYTDSQEGKISEEHTADNNVIFQRLIQELSGKDLAYMDKVLDGINYGCSLYTMVSCPSCKADVAAMVDIRNTEFFRPSNL
jgi:endogenous inhibitor of DNA gyrase (YacG/DUF329 family)